jgi:hypothetical protein
MKGHIKATERGRHNAGERTKEMSFVGIGRYHPSAERNQSIRGHREARSMELVEVLLCGNFAPIAQMSKTMCPPKIAATTVP